MTNSEPAVSIGIPFTTWNELVEQAVNECLQVDYDKFKIVLVPNESSKIPEKYLDDPRIVVAPTKSSPIPLKRNLALRTVDSDFYACIDSDAYPDRQWIKNALSHFSQSDDIWIVGGPNLAPDYADPKRKAVTNALKSFLVGGPRVFVKRRSSHARFVKNLEACNLILRKAVIQELGGFDETLKTGEDTDICERLNQLGKKIYFHPNVIVYHHSRPLFSQFTKQKIVFGYAVLPILQRRFNPGNIFMLLPAAFLFYFLFGWTSIIWSKNFFWLWLSTIIIYFSVVFAEAYRWSENLEETALTALAILIGNLGPGVGTWMKILRIPIFFEKFYVNYSKS